MEKVPAVRYVRHDEGSVAYQVWGDGAVNVLVMTNWPTSVDNIWDHPGRVRFMTIHGTLARVIRLDPRGLGASDPSTSSEPGDSAAWASDAGRVLDELNIERVVVVGEALASHAAIRLAVTDPARVERLALLNGFARLSATQDYSIGHPPAVVNEHVNLVRTTWGTGASTRARLPNLADGGADDDFLARTERLGASRSAATRAIETEFHADVRSILPDVAAPTLVVHTGDFRLIRQAHCEYLANHIPNARHFAAPSRSFYWGDAGFDEYMRFITGSDREASGRELVAILITDLVGSTPAVSALKDRRWRQVLEALDGVAAVEAGRHGGRVVKQLGDGHLMAFPSPFAAVAAALHLLRAAPTLDISMRAGIHFGEVENRSDNDLAGIAVHIASRVAGLAEPGEVLVSRTVADVLAGSSVTFHERGERTLKGVAGTWQLLAVHE